MDSSRYRLVRVLGSGGMAKVYEAIAVGANGFERRVAIKHILPSVGHTESLRKLLFEEARIASHLHHGSIVQVLDYGVADGTEFIALEFVDGMDVYSMQRALQRTMDRGRVPLGLSLHIISEIAHALEYAHTRRGNDGQPLQIVHRDVSPQNILISWDGDVKLSDFGIAFATDRDYKTRTGAVRGKLRYMSPEQARGKKTGPPTDVYALGRTLVEMLRGIEDSDGDEEELATAPPDVEALIDECLRESAEARPSAAEVAARAGQLAASHLGRDGRGAIQEWVAVIKNAKNDDQGLNDVMGLGLFSVEHATDDEEYEKILPTLPPTSNAQTNGSDAYSAPTAMSATAETHAERPAQVRRETRGSHLWMGLGLLAAIAATAFITHTLAGETASPSVDATERSESSESLQFSTAPGAPTSEEPEPEPEPEPEDSVTHAETRQDEPAEEPVAEEPARSPRATAPTRRATAPTQAAAMQTNTAERNAAHTNAAQSTAAPAVRTSRQTSPVASEPATLPIRREPRPQPAAPPTLGPQLLPVGEFDRQVAGSQR